MSDATDPGLATVARRHDLPVEAVAAVRDALRRGRGSQAQFSHPALGGMGQWSRGGGAMIGDMFDHDLKARVDRLCRDLARDDAEAGAGRSSDPAGGMWWPQDLGRPASTGSQNGVHYAVFPATQRLAIRDGAGLRIYDTGDHRLVGVSQRQDAGARALAFTSQHGSVRLDDLDPVDAEPVAATEGERARPSVGGADAPEAPRVPPAEADVLHLLERLFDLLGKGVLTEEEFAAKKRDLLARL